MSGGEEWRKLVDGEVKAAQQEADRLCAIVDEEAEPYKSKYAAIEALKAVQKPVAAALEATGDGALSEEDSKEASRLAGLLALRVGNLLVETEMTGDGEKELARSLELLRVDEGTGASDLMEAHNALGVLWCNRSEYERSKEYLDGAAELYKKAGGGEGSKVVDYTTPLESNYTLTLFYLAQVYGHMRDVVRSAEYCGATLGRQLKSGEGPKDDWAQNATQLAGYYIADGQWSTGERCLAAAAVVLERHRAAPDTRLGDDDVGANVSLGWARLYLMRLSASRDLLYLGPKDGAAEEERPIPDALSFPELGLPPLLRAGGEPVLVRDFEGARALFNAGMRHLNSALGYYKLDGFVTEHTNAIMDKSALYKLIVAFEPDPHRQCVMHRHRAKLVEPLVGQLNPQHFDQQVRQMRYELAELYRETLEIKRDARRPHAKVAAAGRKAVRWYESFMSAFHDTAGKRPSRIQDPETESWYLGAWFNLAGSLHKMQAPTRELAGGDVSNVARSIDEFRALIEYVERNQVDNYAEELALCKEMVSLLPDKMKMLAAPP